MRAAVYLEKNKPLAVQTVADPTPAPGQVVLAVKGAGICGSDLHMVQYGFAAPGQVLGHEFAGEIVALGAGAPSGLKVGDRVCMEPGIPDPNSKATQLGIYNLDPAVRFWATPPVHGVLRPTVVHPAAFTFKLPDNISFAEGAMVEPLAVGMHAANKARIRPGDIAVVSGAGPIGMVTALAALAGGCSQVIMTDVQQPKLDLAATLGPIKPVNVAKEKLTDVVNKLTDGWGADIVFECSGNEKAAAGVFEPLCPGGVVVYVGIPLEPIAYSISAAQIKEARVEHVFRYAHVYPRALALMGSGKIDVKPLITDKFGFKESVAAFDFAVKMPPSSVKAQIELS